LDVNIVSVAYRGYTNSEGSPTEEGLKLDSHVNYCQIYNLIRQ